LFKAWQAYSSSSLEGGKIEVFSLFSILSLTYSSLNFKSFYAMRQDAPAKPISARKKAGNNNPRLL
jgi:hypothetical protein